MAEDKLHHRDKAPEKQSSENNEVGSKLSIDGNKHPKEMDKPAWLQDTPEQYKARVELKNFVGGMLAALKEFDETNKSEIHGFKFSRLDDKRVQVTLPADKPFVVDLHNRNVDDEKDVRYESFEVCNHLIGTLKNDKDGVSFNKISGGKDAQTGKDIRDGSVTHLVAHKFFNDWHVGSHVVDLVSSNNKLLVNYIRPDNKQPGQRQIWPPKRPKSLEIPPPIDEIADGNR